MSDLTYKPESAWEKYAADRQKLRDFAQGYMEFLSQCKTERETIAYVHEKLLAAGCKEDPSSPLFARPLRGKTLFAAKRGTASLKNGLNVIGAHADAPRLDLKQHPFVEQAGIAQAKTHYYGGIRKYQWLARPLALHGVIIGKNGEKIDVNIGERPDDPVFSINDLLPHLAQKQNELKLRDAFEGEKLNIALGHEPAPADGEDKEKAAKDAVKKSILKILHEKYSIAEADFITAELEAVPAGPARWVGLDHSLIGGYGQDDRICVYCALQAFLSSCRDESAHSLALILWDKEEIGSDGATGASSKFFQYCVEDLARAWEPELPVSQVMLASRAISADVTAALDPDYQDVHEKQNAARLGYGPCFSKFTGSRGKYGSSDADAEYFAYLAAILDAENISWQAAELGKVDLGGGGTVALFMAMYGLQVIDLGPALLSMHSPFELASVADLYATFEAFTAFFQS